jgi:co-chaperonin GroES (HSP10)
MALTVTTLAEAPKEAEGYIVEVGLEEKNEHPANKIDWHKEIRDEIVSGGWYVRTGDNDEEEELILTIDELNHSRLPAYVILKQHPTEEQEGIAIHLDDVESKEEASQILEGAFAILESWADEEGERFKKPEEAFKILKEYGPQTLSISINAIGVIQFGTNIL